MAGSAISVVSALLTTIVLEDVLPAGCDQGISTLPATLNQVGTTYCLLGALDTTAGGISINANGVILDGQRSSGARLYGTQAGISVTDRQGVIIRNLETTGSIGINRGSTNQVQNSFMSYLGIDDSDDNLIVGNTIESRSNRGFQVGDLGDHDYVRTDRNIIRNNTFRLSDTHPTRIIDRFINFTGTRWTEFRDNTVSLINVKANPGDNPIMIVMYRTYNGLFSGNDLTIQLDPTYLPAGTGYAGGGIVVRNNSSYNIFEANILHSNARRGLWQQSAAGVQNPQGNIIRFNELYDSDATVNLQAVDDPDAANLIEGNLIYASNNNALMVGALPAGGRVTIRNNTIIAANGDAIVAEGRAANRRLILQNNIIQSRNGLPLTARNYTVESDYNDIYRVDGGTLVSHCAGFNTTDRSYTGCASYASLVAWQGTADDVNSVSIDPLFTDPVNKNFTLQIVPPTSPLIDRGDPITLVPPGGGTRVDLGRYETSVVPCTPSWVYETWTTCDDGQQTRLATDTAIPVCNQSHQQTQLRQACTTGADRTAPTSYISDPTNDGGIPTISGSRTIYATSYDLYGVLGVTFYSDGQKIGTEDTAYNYKVTWDTTTVTNGTHVLTAVSRDAAGNSTTSSPVTVNVQNAAVPAAPSAARSIIGSQIGSLSKPVILGTTSHSAVANPGTWPKFVVEVRDDAGLQLPNKTVTIDFANAGVKLWNYQRSGVTLSCAAKTLSVQTDETGRVSLVPQFGKYNNASTAVSVRVDGVTLGTVAATSADLDGNSGTNPIDLSKFLSVSFSSCINSLTCATFGTASAQVDYNRDGQVNPVDQSLFLAASFVSDTKANYCL